jgi:hypothetical protein
MERVSTVQQSSTAVTPPPNIRGLIEIIEDIRHVFENYFDRTWFAVLIDDLPIDSRTIREIRNLIYLRFFHSGDELSIREGIRELETFISCVRQFLLPVIRDKMGISGFPNKKSILDEHQKILRKFVLYAFPHNLDTLAELTAELKEALYSSYPEIIRPQV